MNTNKESIINNFQNETESKLLDKSFDIKDNYKVNISNLIAEVFIVYVLGIYEGKVDGFDIKPVELNNNILFKIQTTNELPLADVLISKSIKDNKIVITNVLTTVKQL